MGDKIIGIETIRDAVLNSISGLNIVRVLLFGSYARGTADAASDIDLALETGGRFSLLDREKMRSRMEHETGKPVDLISPDYAPPYLRQAIAREGVCLYESI